VIESIYKLEYSLKKRGHLPLTEAVLQGKINCQKITTLSQNGTTNSATTTENSSLNKSTTSSNNQGKSRKSGSQNNTVSNQKTGTLLNYSDRHSGLNTQNIPRITATNMTGTGTEGSGLLNAQVEIPDEKDARFCVLSYDQVKRLNDLMSEVINVHGLGNWATIDVRLSDLVAVVKAKLESDGIKVHEIRLNGSGASSVLASSDINYNDLDLIFSVDLSTAKAFDRVKTACLQSLMELLPEGVCRKRMSSCKLEEAYVSKKVKVNDSGDRWSLISLGNNRAKTVELKFVHTMRRQYEFSVDSFHIMLDTLFLYYECNADATPISENFYPTVVAESMFGDFEEALYHLHKKLIATKNPEEIRGGGLLKYCNLLCRGYRPASHEEVKTMERYMCSRFFIDFPDLNQQQGKLENYLYNHFQSSEDQTKYHYLMILYQVVDESTVCLMGHERRLTLTLIEDMAFQVYSPPMTHYYNSNGSIASPNSDLSLLSPASSNSSSSSSSSASCCSIGSCSNMSISSSSSNCSSASNSGTATPVMSCPPGVPPPVACQQTAVVPVSAGHHAMTTTSHPQQQQTVAVTQQQASGAQPAHIPTYEIVTSSQPAVVYSNGYYYTSFMHQGQQEATPMPTTTVHAPPTVNVVTMSPGGCLACSCNQWAASNQQAAGHTHHQPTHHAHQPHHHQQLHHAAPHYMTQVPQQS